MESFISPPKKNLTPLEKIQKEIDGCNGFCGCDSKCTLEEQRECWLLASHAKRMEYCLEQGIPMWAW